jgi:hypothetical protein
LASSTVKTATETIEPAAVLRNPGRLQRFPDEVFDRLEADQGVHTIEYAIAL